MDRMDKAWRRMALYATDELRKCGLTGRC